jgi:hypothetical protein
MSFQYSRNDEMSRKSHDVDSVEPGVMHMHGHVQTFFYDRPGFKGFGMPRLQVANPVKEDKKRQETLNRHASVY